MKFTSNFILICVINCLCKDIISISIDNDKSKDSIESDDKNIKIEIKKARNQSQENIIPISSSSGSLEHYEQTALPGQQQNPWIIMQKGKQKTDWDSDRKYSGRILSSIEETSDLWAETRKDNAYSAKMRSEPQTDNIFHDKIINYFENLRKTPTMMARKYLEKLRTSSQNEQENMTERVGTTQEEITSYSLSNKQTNDGTNYRASISTECGNVNKKKKLHDEIPVTRKHKQKTKENDKNCPEKTPCEDTKNVNLRTALMNVLHLTSSKIQRTREMPPCKNYNANEFTGIAVSNSSTIAMNNRKYQASSDVEESEATGDQDTLDDYPYSASVQRKGAHYASGALVGERWILSTAAEFYNIRETIKLFRIRVGSVNCKKGGIFTPVKSIAIHPEFIPRKHAFDISVLKTAEPLPLSSVIQPIGLTRVPVKVTTSAKFLSTYWPRIVVNGVVIPPTAKERVKYTNMRVSTQQLVPTDKCRQQLAAVNVTLDKNTLCLRPVTIHHSDCMPDVGAPVVAVDGLWGITSGWVSPQCPSVLLPTLFTKVSSLALRNWINDQMQ